jgi:SAM-dependent methyltransferase
MAGGSEVRSDQGTTPERWAEAQVAEKSFWETSTYRAEVFSATLAVLAGSATWMQEHLTRELPGGDRVELGIGPMGLGCIQLLPRPQGVRLIGVDPLEQTPAMDWPLPEPQLSIVRAFQGTYEHVVGRAEETGLEAGRAGVAVLHNMLDHVQEPAAVLAEASRLLRADGVLLLVCDTISVANQLRMRLYTRRRFADTLFVRAHPFHFRVGQLIGLVRDAGFRVLASNRRRPALLYGTIGHSHRLLLLAEKA